MYVAEQSFYTSYNIYLTCLKYMGYDPSEVVLSRYYSNGFRDSGSVNTALYDSSQTFTAGAAGVVHKKFTSSTQSLFMTIDQLKVIRIIRNGF